MVCAANYFLGSTGYVYAQQFIFYAAFHSIVNVVHPDCSSAALAVLGSLGKARSSSNNIMAAAAVLLFTSEDSHPDYFSAEEQECGGLGRGLEGGFRGCRGLGS